MPNRTYHYRVTATDFLKDRLSLMDEVMIRGRKLWVYHPSHPDLDFVVIDFRHDYAEGRGKESTARAAQRFKLFAQRLQRCTCLVLTCKRLPEALAMTPEEARFNRLISERTTWKEYGECKRSKPRGSRAGVRANV